MSKAIHVFDIEWDTEGETIEECNLPSQVVMIDVPNDVDQEELEDTISNQLSDSFGFCHYSWNWQVLTPAQDTHGGGGFFPARLGIMRWVS